jgi:hypothetical protein
MESQPDVPPAQHTSDEAPVVPIANGLTGPPRDFHEVALPLLDDVTRFALAHPGRGRSRGSGAGHLPSGMSLLANVQGGVELPKLALHDLPQPVL